MSTPAPGTGKRRWHSRKDGGKSGVSGGSRIIPHRYQDEGDNGPWFRRLVRRRESAMWIRELGEDE